MLISRSLERSQMKNTKRAATKTSAITQTRQATQTNDDAPKVSIPPKGERLDAVRPGGHARRGKRTGDGMLVKGKQSNRDRILNAALVCFDRFGVGKTTMDDVADAAQLGRMTVYRVFANRTALLEAVAFQKLEGFAAELVRIIKPLTSFEEAFITVSMKSIDMALSDPLFMSLMENTGGDGGVERLVVIDDTPIGDLMKKIWGDILARGRASGELRADIEDKELMTWSRDIQYLLLLRDDLDTKGREALLRKFVIPALLSKSAR